MSHTHIKKEQGEGLKVEKDATVTKPFHPTDKLAQRIHHHEKTNAVEILEGLRDGELPSNEKINRELEVAKHFAEHIGNIASTKEHEEMMRDIKNFVDVSQKTLDEKNRDDLLQRFVADIGALIEKPTLMSDNVSPKEMKTDVKELLKSLRVVLMTLIKSNNFRNACIDFVKIIRELFNYHNKQTQPAGRLTEAFVATDKHTKDEAKNIATDVKSKMQNMTITDIPQKHRDRIMANIKKLIRELNEHPDSREAFSRLLNIWGSISTELYAHWDSNANDPEFNRVYMEAIALVESYTGGRSLKEFLNRFRKSMMIIEKDKEITAFFKEFREFLSTAINKPELIDNQAFIDRGYALIKQGRAHARRYKEDLVINSCIDEAAELAYLIKRDTRMHQLKKQAAKVASDFVYVDKKGRRHFNSDILPIIRQEIVPFLISRIKEVPVPGFQMEGPDFEYLIVDDIFITIDDVFPDMVKVHLYNDTELGLGGDHTPGLHHKSYLKIMIEGIRPKVKDFFFSFKRKKVITIADEGRADLRITGTGINIYIKFELKADPEDKYRSILGVAETDVMVDSVELDILEAKHKTLLNFVTSLFKGRIRTQTENAMKSKIAEYAVDLATAINKKVISGVTMATVGQPGNKLP